MNNCKMFSIIVPVYNIDGYIEECIKSILSQTFQNFELILVDDGSTDKSGFICDEYSKQDNRIKVIHKTNGGLSDARNTGIKNSHGLYLMFIDGDDKLFNNKCLEILSDEINAESCDVIQYKMIYLYQDKYKFFKNVDMDNYENNLDYLRDLNRKGILSVSACDKIVKRSIIEENNIYFEKNLTAEDIKWSYQLYLCVKNKIKYISKDIYVYRQQRTGSLTQQKNKKAAGDLMSTVNYWLNYDYSSEEYKNLYLNMIAYWYLIIRVNYNSECYTKQMKEEFKNIDKFIFHYHENYKVKMAWNFKRIFGLKITIFLMKIYNNFKNIGFIKL